MTAEHFVEVEADEDGCPWLTRFSCAGTDADECHQWCAEGCEEECHGLPIRLWSPEDPQALRQPLAPVAGHRWTPAAYTSGGCRIVDWLDAEGADDTYVGDDEPWGASSARPGKHRIDVEWNGDSYEWAYLDEEPAVPGRPL